MVWLPRTAGVGEDDAVEDAVAIAAVVGVGGPDCGPEGDGETAADGDAVCGVGVVCAVEAVDVLADVGDGLGLT